MIRKNLNVLTKISFFTAIMIITVVPIAAYIASRTANESISSVLRALLLLAFLASVFAIPISIVSMFSREKLLKRIFAFVVNSLPISLLIYAIIVESIE